jgi:tRNA (cytidine/uridine-2'-O-)-methyltransferase
MRIALYQPDIPQNTGAILRLAACFSIGIDVIEPCGFVWDDRRLRRAGMDYLEMAQLRRHVSWSCYLAERPAGRLLLLSTRAEASHLTCAFRQDDTLLLGRESAGVPDFIHDAVDQRLRIPLSAGARSLNVALAAAIVLGEALRQIDGFPTTEGSLVRRT